MSSFCFNFNNIQVPKLYKSVTNYDNKLSEKYADIDEKEKRDLLSKNSKSKLRGFANSE